MRKFLVSVLALASVLVLAIIVLFLHWNFKPKRSINFYILDKTVTRFDRPEHKAFIWFLNRNRYVGPDGAPYSVKSDYWGFYPIDLPNQLFDFKAIRLKEVSAYASVYDAVYYTDSYGVYSFEWYRNGSSPIKSSKVYGGLNQNDYFFLKEMVRQNKLAIGEYNMLSSPTNALIRRKTEMLFNLSWTGWAGKYYGSLNPAGPGGPPEWMPALYQSQHLKPWPTERSGIVLLSNEGLLEVLIDGDDLQQSYPLLIPGKLLQERYGIAQSVRFAGWFEFMMPNESASVEATFRIDVSPAGREKFNSLGLDPAFPAIIRSQPKSNTYYFAGDFAENPVWMPTSRLTGGTWINRIILGHSARAEFFYEFYLPLMEGIVGDYYSKLEYSR